MCQRRFPSLGKWEQDTGQYLKKNERLVTFCKEAELERGRNERGELEID